MPVNPLLVNATDASRVVSMQFAGLEVTDVGFPRQCGLSDSRSKTSVSKSVPSMTWVGATLNEFGTGSRCRYYWAPSTVAENGELDTDKVLVTIPPPAGKVG